jgi:hypothetical protein
MITLDHKLLRGSMKFLLISSLVLGLSCAADAQTRFQERVQSIADEMVPEVEEGIGLEFAYPPNVAVRSPEEVRDFLFRRMDADFPQEEIDRITTAYRLFRLLPEQIDLKSLLIDLYSEQIIGFFDPETDTLYVVEGDDPDGPNFELRLTVGHELVHALQAQHTPIADFLEAKGDNDRRLAAQAVFEGQAMLFSLMSSVPDPSVVQSREFWNTVRSAIRQEREKMPVLASAPLILREGLIFPYIDGADFMRWYTSENDDSPFDDRLPQSTEQILLPERYGAGDNPVTMRFEGEPTFEDNLGAFEMRILFSELTGSLARGEATIQDWGGDRYGVYSVDDEHALVWWTAWDNPVAADRFASRLDAEWGEDVEDGRAYRVGRTQVGDHPAVFLVDAPEGWDGLGVVPGVVVRDGG